MPYKDLNQSLRYFRMQVADSLDYAKHEVPKLDTPEQIFDWLKRRIRYKNDPKNTELFQTLPTLLDNNWHGITGAGDCDCFTIAALSTLIANGFFNCGIVLVGRNPLNAAHIYAYVDLDNGKREYLDLTNKYYNQTRYYPNKQSVPFIINPQEKKAMQLQLADMGARRPRRKQKLDPRIERERQAAIFRAKQMQGKVMRRNQHHIWLPSKGVQLREDYFDDTMHDGEFQHMLLSEGYEPLEIAELAGRRGDRRRAKKDEKRALKKEKKQSKIELRKARAQKKRDKGEAAKERAAARRDKWASKGKGGGGGDDDDEESGWQGKVGKYFNKAVGGVGKVMNAYRGIKGETEGEEPEGGEGEAMENAPTARRTRNVEDVDATPTDTTSVPTRKASTPIKPPAKMVTILGKEMKQSTAIGLGIGTAILIGGAIYGGNQIRKRRAARQAA